LQSGGLDGGFVFAGVFFFLLNVSIRYIWILVYTVGWGMNVSSPYVVFSLYGWVGICWRPSVFFSLRLMSQKTEDNCKINLSFRV